MKKWQIATISTVVVLAVALGCLFGGRAWGASGSDTGTVDQTPGQMMGNDGTLLGRGDGSAPRDGLGLRNGGGLVIGSIIAIDESSITVKTNDGSTKIVLVPGSTSISLVTTGSASDLKTGEKVTVTGTTNDDGAVTATSIRLGDVVVVTPGRATPAGDTSTDQ